MEINKAYQVNELVHRLTNMQNVRADIAEAIDSLKEKEARLARPTACFISIDLTKCIHITPGIMLDLLKESAHLYDEKIADLKQQIEAL